MSSDDDKRDRAIVLLQEHYAKNRLEIEEFERRVELAERAQSGREIERALDGLPVIAEVIEPVKDEKTVRATFGSIARRGPHALARRTIIKAMFGSVELDLTEAELQRGVSTIELDALFGSVTLTVPDDLDIESDGHAIFGSFEHMSQRKRSKKDPRSLRIVGRARFGSVEIVVQRKPPPTLLDGLKEGLREGVRGLLGK
jgi:hypothetical protein